MIIMLVRLCIIQLKLYAREINHICNMIQMKMKLETSRLLTWKEASAIDVSSGSD